MTEPWWHYAVGFGIATAVFWGGVFYVDRLRARWRQQIIDKAEQLRNAPGVTPELRKAYEHYIANYRGD